MPGRISAANPQARGSGREILGCVAAGETERDVAKTAQAVAERLLRQSRHPDAGTAAMEVEDDRQDLAVVDCLDLVAIAPEAPPHAGRGPGLDLDMDQERLPALAQERYPDQEIQLATPAPGGEELLVQEHRMPEVEPPRQVRHHEP